MDSTNDLVDGCFAFVMIIIIIVMISFLAIFSYKAIFEADANGKYCYVESGFYIHDRCITPVPVQENSK